MNADVHFVTVIDDCDNVYLSRAGTMRFSETVENFSKNVANFALLFANLHVKCTDCDCKKFRVLGFHVSMSQRNEPSEFIPTKMLNRITTLTQEFRLCITIVNFFNVERTYVHCSQ